MKIPLKQNFNNINFKRNQNRNIYKKKKMELDNKAREAMRRYAIYELSHDSFSKQFETVIGDYEKLNIKMPAWVQTICNNFFLINCDDESWNADEYSYVDLRSDVNQVIEDMEEDCTIDNNI